MMDDHRLWGGSAGSNGVKAEEAPAVAKPATRKKSRFSEATVNLDPAIGTSLHCENIKHHSDAQIHSQDYNHLIEFSPTDADNAF